MKPSEYLKKEYSKGYEDHGHTSIEVHCILGSSDVDEDKLDKRFIDKEELKNKLKKLNYSLDLKGNMPYRQKIYLDEILKLLEE